ncbi:uncharacterized protein PFL1_06332 [Pseudozyma flocculosa PF-1]|uniref:Major facilitator superfamily (MFS) profile domain-containing protein n=1 Tax=Pseudozyma flocculosa PF-1 TaxID=1277687 RepID=A0A061H1W1_9BASI|nr:uncharacterized protein PFL1_06332 [Pseudozyma flocculosa PF-1]EPQ26124.1 hypothetical protein PFL1_06332 [Pseudozyma flocculosa PF-1]
MSARDASTRDAKIPTPRRAGRHDPPTFFVPSTSASAPASAATPDNAGPPHPAAPAGNDHRPTLNAKEASSRSLGLRLTRTHSRKDLYDADAGSVDGEFGAYGHASEDQAHAGAAPVRRMHSRSKSKTQRHETVLERIGDLERDDVELGAHEARQLAEVRAGGTGEDEMDHERRRRNRLRKQTGNAALHTVFDADGGEAWYTRFGHNLVRPFILLTTQPIIQVFSVFMMILYGCMYILLTVFPLVFEETYGERPGVASLNYISLAIGFTVGGQVGGRVVDRVYRRLRDGRGGGVGQPEYKLPLLMVSSLLLPVGLVVYGWTAERRVHWIVPNLGAVVFSAGLMASFLVSQSYLVDVMPLYAASALAAAVFLRSLGGFGFPLFAPVMYDKLGQGWGNSVLALISAIVGIPAPWLLWRYGPYLRSKSQYASKQKAGNALS